MTHDLISILEAVKEHFTDSSDMLWTNYDHPRDVRNDLERLIYQLQSGDTSCLPTVHALFLPTSTFQEHALSNDWVKDYLRLSDQFEQLYASIEF
ncbi:hypothetical protein [Spirosoma gilvum]